MMAGETVDHIVAVIPARGGSKGIERKNLRTVGGIPLVARAIAACRNAVAVHRVIVSTDDREIAVVSEASGAEVFQRSTDLATDAATSEAVVTDVLGQLRARGDVEPSVTLLVQCTSPLTTGRDIDALIRLLDEQRADSAFTASRRHLHLWRTRGDGEAIPVNHDSGIRLRRQEREPEYVETGAAYAMRTVGFLAAAHRFFGRVVLLDIDALRSVEIDDPIDLIVANALVRNASQREKSRKLPEFVMALVLDFDGVITDDRVVTSADGTEAVVSSRTDSLGIARLRERGLPLLVLSTEKSPTVAARCSKLGVEVIQGSSDKLRALTRWLEQRNLDLPHCVFVGNDVNDLECLRAVGCGVVTRDAHPTVLELADVVLDASGGRGAVREIADLILCRLGAGQRDG